MQMKQWLADQVSAPTKRALPILSFPCVQLLSITVKDLISSSENQADGMAAIAARYDTAAAVSMMDLSVEAEAFGAEVRFSDDEVPTVTGRLIQSPEDAAALRVPPVGAGRTGLYIEAIQKACAKITDRPVLAGVIGPFSLAGRLMDMTEIMMNCYIEPDMVHETMRKATDFLIEYAKAYKAAGANGIVMAEPASGLLSPDLHKTFSAPYVKEIIDAVSDDGFIVIYHNCGNVVPLIEDIYALGADAYHFGNAIQLIDVIGKADPSVPIMGNIDPVAQFRNGTPESMQQATTELLQQLHAYPNFIISSGCDIPPVSKLENIDAFFKAVKQFYDEQ